MLLASESHQIPIRHANISEGMNQNRAMSFKNQDIAVRVLQTDRSPSEL